MIYVATAYYLGFHNRTPQYLVAVGTDKQAIIDQSEFDAAERASKYGIEVREYPDYDCIRIPEWSGEAPPGAPPQLSGDVVYYAPSWRGETELEADPREPYIVHLWTHLAAMVRENLNDADIAAFAREVIANIENAGKGDNDD